MCRVEQQWHKILLSVLLYCSSNKECNCKIQGIIVHFRFYIEIIIQAFYVTELYNSLTVYIRKAWSNGYKNIFNVRVNTTHTQKKQLWKVEIMCIFPSPFLHIFFIFFKIKIFKHLTKLSAENIYAVGNLLHMLNCIYFKIYSWTLSLFSVSSFLSYTLIF